METFDDRQDHLSYKSDCLFCKNFDPLYLTCSAYPAGIPNSILECKELHRQVRNDQVGSYIYEPELR